MVFLSLWRFSLHLAILNLSFLELYSSRVVALTIFLYVNVVFQLTHTYSTHPVIQDVHDIAGQLVPYNHACPKRGLIHRYRESSVIRPLLYLQASKAGSSITNLFSLNLPESSYIYISEFNGDNFQISFEFLRTIQSFHFDHLF